MSLQNHRIINRKISIAPMMDCTDKHDRYFLRLISPHCLLYTEMITTGALVYGDREKFLAFDKFEHPIALQLGGSDPTALATCAKMAEDHGYDEVNLNVGCPSDRVQSGKFGACLMLEPSLVADCIAAMNQVVKIPVTVKCRIGVDEQDSFESLCEFIKTIAKTGCDVFIIHARKAWLKGLSPKQNREVPPLQYDVVYQLKKLFPELTIILNGGLKTISQVNENLPHVDGVMIGREAYANPYFLAQIEKEVFNFDVTTRREIIEKFIPYVEEQLKQNIRLSTITRHIFGMFHAQPGGRNWRRYLSENAYKATDVGVILQALELC